MHSLLKKILDVFIPPSVESVVVRQLSEEKLHALMRVSLGPHLWIYALFPYREPQIRALIRSIKYRGERAPLEMLGHILAEELLEILADKYALAGWQEALLVPLPSSKKRLRERGYKQTGRIGEKVAGHLGSSVRYAPKLLERENRDSQTHFSYEKRKENIAGAFFVSPALKSMAQGACIILLDDVVESGSTLSDARRALLSAGAQDVIAIAVAK